MEDKKHWYDGKFYDKFIAPNQDKIFEQIKKIIKKETLILDVGCGTGRLAFQLSEHCEKIVGVDLSSKNIAVANMNHCAKFNNVEFLHGSIAEVKQKYSNKFDYAVLTFVIHEVPENERMNLLTSIKSVCRNLIICDYIAPTPKTIWGMQNVIIEFLAGKDHYLNFKNYIKNGGLNYLVKEANLEKKLEVKNQPQTTHLVVLE